MLLGSGPGFADLLTDEHGYAAARLIGPTTAGIGSVRAAAGSLQVSIPVEFGQPVIARGSRTPAAISGHTGELLPRVVQFRVTHEGKPVSGEAVHLTLSEGSGAEFAAGAGSRLLASHISAGTATLTTDGSGHASLWLVPPPSPGVKTLTATLGNGSNASLTLNLTPPAGGDTGDGPGPGGTEEPNPPHVLTLKAVSQRVTTFEQINKNVRSRDGEAYPNFQVHRIVRYQSYMGGWSEPVWEPPQGDPFFRGAAPVPENEIGYGSFPDFTHASRGFTAYSSHATNTAYEVSEDDGSMEGGSLYTGIFTMNWKEDSRAKVRLVALSTEAAGTVALPQGAKATYLPVITTRRFAVEYSQRRYETDEDGNIVEEINVLPAVTFQIPREASASDDRLDRQLADFGQFFPAKENSDVALSLLPVEVKDVSNNQIITDTAWIKGHKTDGSSEEPEWPKLEARISGLPANMQVEWKLENRYPRRNGRDDLNIPGVDGAEPGIFTTGSEAWKIWETVQNTSTPYFGGDVKVKFQLHGGSGASGTWNEVSFKVWGENPDDARCKAHIIANQGDVWYAWAISKHEGKIALRSGAVHYYCQFNPPEANNPNEPNYSNYQGDDGWGLFQRDSASGYPVTTEETWSWDGNVQGFINDEYPEHLRIANTYVDSVKRNNPHTFEEPQFTIKGRAISGRHVLALTWYNGPQGRSNSRLLHFDGSKPVGQRWSLDLPNAPRKDQPYVHEIMDQYNGG